MNLDLWLKLLNAAVIVGSVCVNAYLFVKARSDQRFSEIDQSLAEYDQALHIETAERKAFDNELDKRLVALETEFESIPRHDDLEAIRSALGDVRAGLSAVNERSTVTLDGVRRIEQHLMDRSQ